MRRCRCPEAFGSLLPPGEERDNLERARRYLAAIERDGAADGPFTFLAADIRQVEYPNQFLPKGAERDLAAMAEAAERGRRVLQRSAVDLCRDAARRLLGYRSGDSWPSVYSHLARWALTDDWIVVGEVETYFQWRPI